MKKSDKLLLFLVLTALVLFSSAHLRLYWKYKNGAANNYGLIDKSIRQNLPAAKFVVLEGIDNVQLIPSDSFAIEYYQAVYPPNSSVTAEERRFQKDRRPVRFYYIGDSLVISGYDTIPAEHPGDGPTINTKNHMNLYFRDIALLTKSDGDLVLKGDSAANPAHSLRLQLNGVRMYTDGSISMDKTYFDQLSISADSSQVNLDAHIRVNTLRLRLDERSNADVLCDADKIYLDCADPAQITFKAANLRHLQAASPNPNSK